MDHISHKNIFTWWQLLLLGSLIFFPLFGMSPDTNLGSDAEGYIHPQLCRPPLYPIFLWVFRIFASQQLIVARWAQTILTLFSLLYAGWWLQKNLHVPKFISFLIILTMIMIMSLHTHTLAWIFSEGIAFPIFIVTFLLWVENCKNLNAKTFFMVVMGSSLLILTRNQFYYLYPVLALCVLWHFWRGLSWQKMLGYFTIIILSALMTVLFAQSYYDWIGRHIGPSHSAADWKYSGWRVLVQPIYLADQSAEKLFQNPVEKKLFIHLFNQVNKDQYTRLSAAPLHENNNLLAAEYHYMSTLGKLQDSVRIAIKTHIPKGVSADKVDQLLFHISKTLVLNALKENISFYLLRVTFYAGGFWIFLSSLITLFAMSYRILTDRKWQPSMGQAFIMLALLLILLNAAFVALVEIQSARYFYYPIFLYFCLFGLLASEFMKKKADNQFSEVNVLQQSNVAAHAKLGMPESVN